MSVSKLLIANRGEIAIRIARAAAELEIPSVAVYPADDAACRHVAVADEARELPGGGAAAYLDAEALVAAAQQTGCDAVHPGYGFLSESAELAGRCAEAGLTFVGPAPETLALFGDKARARALAGEHDVPLLAGTDKATGIDEARELLGSMNSGGAIVLKPLAGGGGRGIRVVRDPAELEQAFERCRSEAASAFGSGELYVEQFLPRARHVEVQVLGDGAGAISHLFERECSLQRRHQKLVELAPSPSVDEPLRAALTDAAVRLATAGSYRGLGTFEFLVDTEAAADAPGFAFMEANPRLQVEHTVTEEVTGIDLVKAQLRIAADETLHGLGLTREAIPAPRGHAIQVRINMETLAADGTVQPSGGTLTAFEPPSGPGVRVDSHGYPGYTSHPGFDSLLAKVIAHEPGNRFADAVARARRALAEFRIDGIETNLALMQSLLVRREVAENTVHTGFVDEHLGELLADMGAAPRRHFAGAPAATIAETRASAAGPEGTTPVSAPMQGRVVSVDTAEGDAVRPGQQVAVLEAMKMEYVITAGTGGVVRKLAVEPGDNVFAEDPLVFVEERDELAEAVEQESGEVDPDHVRPDLAEVVDRHARGHDEQRPEAVARRRKRGHRTARENIADLCDPGSFIEYGALAIAAQRSRRSLDDLIDNTPADGMIAGMASVNGELFDAERARCLVLSYDYTVLAGTQGAMNHKKKDRVLSLAEQHRLPIVFFAEGGGGRPGDTDVPAVAGLDTPSFVQYARLSGLVPRIGIVTGRCCAGNAALAGCSDLVVATEDSTIGMGGPAMIEGGGLGSYEPEEVGPTSVQSPNGVIDLLVADEAEAVARARQLLTYFQGPVAHWDCPDQRRLRRAVPENRRRAYDVREVIDRLADTGSVVELRRPYAPGMITAFIRIEGRPLGLIANDPAHLAGAIEADGADKAARFLQLCDAFDIPVVTLCDTPGIMVGPEAEKTALVRHASRLFVAGANVSVPIFTIVLRKGYGLGAQAMAGGSFHTPFFIASWPTGEFGGMGLEGAVRLGYRKELDAVEDPDERDKLFEQMVAQAYEHGKATNMASYLEIDAVIDPRDTRDWLVRGLESVPSSPPREGKKRTQVDTW